MKRLMIWAWLMVLAGTAFAQAGIYDIPPAFTADVMLSSQIAITRAGRIFVTNPLAQTVSLLDLDRSIQAEFAMNGDPRSVAIVPDNERGLALSTQQMLVIDLNSNAILGNYDLSGRAFGVVADEQFAYISLQANNEIVVLNLDDGRIQQRIPTPPHPSGLAKWGDFLYVTHFWSGELSLIYLPTADLVRTVQVHPQGTLFAALEINTVEGIAYLPQSIANTSASATTGNRLIPMLYEMDLSTMAVTRTINLAAADRNLSIPYAVRQSSNRTRLYITAAASGSITVLNLNTLAAEQHIEIGSSPRGLVFTSDYLRLISPDSFYGTVSIIDTRFFSVQDQVSSTDNRLDVQTQLGNQLFYNARDARLSDNGLIACASCHWDRQADGRMWQGQPTIALDAVTITAETLNQHIADLQGGTGLLPDSIDMDAILAFLAQSR